jgi:hypothetical protein
LAKYKLQQKGGLKPRRNMTVDIVVIENTKQYATIHCWGERGNAYTVNSFVPRIDNNSTYSIKTATGIVINVGNDMIVNINTDDFAFFQPVYDSFGRLFNEENAKISEQIFNLAHAS